VTSDPTPAPAAEADGDVGSTAAGTADADAVVVRLGVGRFAIALADVAEVGRVPAVTRVPGLPAWVAGVVNWRGRVLAALDLRGALGADRTALTPAARLVVLVRDAVTVGVLVDRVDGMTVLGEEVADFPAALPASGAGLVSGQVPRDDGPVAVLDVEAVLRLRETLPRPRRTA
jgi:purine-binding chemotaxis protein CheW